MKLSLLTLFTAVAVASTTVFSLSQPQLGITASVILGLSVFHHSLVAAFAVPQNLRLDARHGNHNSGNDTDGNDPDDRERNRANSRNETREDSDRSNRDRNDTTGATRGDGNNGDNPRNGRTGAGGSGSRGNNVDGVPSTGSHRNNNGTATRTGEESFSTGTGNAVGRNGTSSGSDGNGGQAGKGTLPAGFPPAVPGLGFVAGEKKRSVAGLPRSVVARRDYQISRKIGRTARMKVPVSPKRDAYRDTYDV